MTNASNQDLRNVSRAHGAVHQAILNGREVAVKVIKLPDNNDAQVKLYLKEVSVMFTMNSEVRTRAKAFVYTCF